jgi:endonuclease YncB( thermonuclease family)
MADTLTTTLLILYLVAPAKTVHLNGTTEAKDAFEKTQLWTFQSASQITTENPNECVSDGLILRQKFAPVSTVTVRLYCFCSEDAVKKYNVCETENNKTASLATFRKLGTPPPTAVIEIGPDTKMPK